MFGFLSTSVPDRLQSHWIRAHLIAEEILNANPSIINYWIYVRRDALYRHLSSSNLNSVEDVWTKISATNHDVLASDIEQIYQFIRTSIHIVVHNNTCSSSYYAQTKQNDDGTITICLSHRLLSSASNAFVFVATAVLFRELSRALWPECLKNTSSTRFLQNPWFYSWSGIPETLWANKWREKYGKSKFLPRIYVTCPANGRTNMVSDAGNLFQHLFYNGEVHLYDDEIDDRGEPNIIHVALRVHQTESSLCAARYLHEKLLDDFFNISQYSLEMIRQINDQTCPYFKYWPIEKKGNRTYDIVLDTDRDVTQHVGSFSEYSVSYQFKPYEPNVPQQHYEQSVFIGYSQITCPNKCARLFQYVVQTDDIFFLENRWLFRRRSLELPIASACPFQLSNSSLEKIDQEPARISIWIRSIRRLQTFYEDFIRKIFVATNGKKN